MKRSYVPFIVSDHLFVVRRITISAAVCAVIVAHLATVDLRADSFGSFDIDFVTVGDPGNQDDTGTTGSYFTIRGGVNYYFRIAKFEVSRAMITSANGTGLGITLADMSPYNSGDTPNSPATGISWNEAARFVNWLNTSTGYPPAYKFAVQPGEGSYDSNTNIELWESGDSGYSPSNPYRNTNARYFLPSEDEWYKAAFYSGTGSTYYDFSTGSDTVPDGVDFDGDTVFDDWVDDPYNPGGPTEIDNVTINTKPSHYGTYFQGGNVKEMTESDYTVPNNDAAENRATRGIHWVGFTNNMSSSGRGSQATTGEFASVGFRVASKSDFVEPPPSTDPNEIIKKSLTAKIKKLKKSLKRVKKAKSSKVAKVKKKLKKLKRLLATL